MNAKYKAFVPVADNLGLKMVVVYPFLVFEVTFAFQLFSSRVSHQ
ncbi:hypothetical protein [Arsenophonus sp. PmNCSU2021_1]